MLDTDKDKPPLEHPEETKPELPQHILEETTSMFSRAALSDSDQLADDEESNEDEESADFMSMLPTDIRHRVEKLKDLNTQRDSITEYYLLERAALEQKYVKLFLPMYDMRMEIIKGLQDQIIQEANQPSNDDEKKAAKSKDSNEGENSERLIGIPEFWVHAMSNIEVIGELITGQDTACLLYMENISHVDFPDGKGFTLKFNFKENPFFFNDILTKRYDVPNLLFDEEPMLKKVVGCDIKWKPNMCLTEKKVTKKQRSKSGKRSGQIRTITKTERTDSFFHFFNPPKLPSTEMDEAEAEAIEEAFDHDYEIAQSFRSYIIPKAVLWFTGEALEEDYN